LPGSKETLVVASDVRCSEIHGTRCETGQLGIASGGSSEGCDFPRGQQSRLDPRRSLNPYRALKMQAPRSDGEIGIPHSWQDDIVLDCGSTAAARERTLHHVGNRGLFIVDTLLMLVFKLQQGTPPSPGRSSSHQSPCFRVYHGKSVLASSPLPGLRQAVDFSPYYGPGLRASL